jgi:hypothetical protein
MLPQGWWLSGITLVWDLEKGLGSNPLVCKWKSCQIFAVKAWFQGANGLLGWICCVVFFRKNGE